MTEPIWCPACDRTHPVPAKWRCTSCGEEWFDSGVMAGVPDYDSIRCVCPMGSEPEFEEVRT